MFLYNNWYMVAFDQDLKPGEVLSRRVCNKPVALFRTADGTLAAVEDRCSHRAMPLSMGQVCGSNIRCPYHGLEFDADGVCRKIPGQEDIPGAASIISYPLHQQNTQIWIWVGDKEKADPSLVADFPYDADPNWACTSEMFEYKAAAELVIDNLLDMSHIAFVHTLANGDSSAHTNAEMHVRPTTRGVEVIRHLPNCDAPAAYRVGKDFEGKIDRWQEFEFIPGLVRFWTGGTDAGTGAFEGKREGGVQLRHIHAITPATETSCYYHFINARNFALDNPDLAKQSHRVSQVTIGEEDRPVIEAQQARLLEDPDRKLVDVRADAPGLQARRIMRRLISEERAAVVQPSLAKAIREDVAAA